MYPLPEKSQPLPQLPFGNMVTYQKLLEEKGLSKREIEVARWVGGGLNNKQVSELLGIAVKTIKFHLCMIYKKLGITSRAQLVLYTANLCNEISKYTKEELLDLLLEAYGQSCSTYDREAKTFSYDHMCLSTWETVQRVLIDSKKITPEQCRRV